MKRFYSKFRIGLITFAFGLASVFVLNGSLQSSDEIPVNLPEIHSESPIIIFPRYSKEIPLGGGGAGRGRLGVSYEVQETLKPTNNN